MANKRKFEPWCYGLATATAYTFVVLGITQAAILLTLYLSGECDKYGITIMHAAESAVGLLGSVWMLAITGVAVDGARAAHEQ